MKNVAVTISLPPDVNALLRTMAKAQGINRSAVIRHALGIMQALEIDTKAGRFIGAASNRDALETVIVSPL